MCTPGKTIRRAVGRLAPPGTRRRAALVGLADRHQGERAAAYAAWMAETEPAGWAPPADPAAGPMISVVVPAFNTPDRYLRAAVDSVLAQSYPRWELCLVDGSTDPARSEAIRAQAARDGRIRLVAVGANRGIAGNTNAGIDAAQGDYVGFLDHDDTLAPQALNEVAAALRTHPATGVLYSDEDKLTEDGARRCDPVFKMGWSPDRLRYSNYVCHFLTVRADLLASVGGLRPGFDGAQDYDLLLRLAGATPGAVHIPRVLYHWRYAKASTARGPRAKQGAGGAGLSALADALAGEGVAAAVEQIPGYPTSYRVRYRPAASPAVHILADGPAPATLPAAMDGPVLHALGSVADLEALPDGDVVLLAGGRLSPLEPGWLAELTAVAMRPGTGAVMPALVDGNGTGAGAGYGAWNGRLVPLLAGRRWEAFTPDSPLAAPRNVIACGGCLAIGAGQMKALLAGGAQPTCASLSLAAHTAGARNVYWPFARLRCAGPLPEVVLDAPLGAPLDDPYLNPNLGPDQAGLPAPAAAPAGPAGP